MIIETIPFLRLTELFVVALNTSSRIAVCGSSGIGKTVAAGAFAQARPGRVAVWSATDDKSRSSAVQELLLAAVPLAQRENVLARANKAAGAERPDPRQPDLLATPELLLELAPPHDGNCARRRKSTMLAHLVRRGLIKPAPFLLIIDDAHEVGIRTLKNIMTEVEGAGEELPFGLVMLGNEKLELPSNAPLRACRSRSKSLDALKGRIILGPTMTTRALSGEDIAMMATACGASDVEACNLRDLHALGRIDPTFPSLRQMIRKSRRAARHSQRSYQPSASGTNVTIW